MRIKKYKPNGINYSHRNSFVFNLTKYLFDLVCVPLSVCVDIDTLYKNGFFLVGQRKNKTRKQPITKLCRNFSKYNIIDKFWRSDLMFSTHSFVTFNILLDAHCVQCTHRRVWITTPIKNET